MRHQNLNRREYDQIGKRLVELSSVTFNIKSIAYSMASIPLETVKHKYSLNNASILTTIDSIYYDMKRIETILIKHSHLSEGCAKSSNNRLNSYSSANLRFNQIKTAQLEAFNYSSHNYKAIIPDMNVRNDNCFKKQLSNHKINVPSNPHSNLTYKAHVNLLQHTFQPQQVSEYSSGDGNKQFISKTLPINEYKKRKQSHQVGISQVSSYQYVGLSHNPTIKHHTRHHGQEVNGLQTEKSRLKVDTGNKQEHEKQAENEKFLREISKSREKILRSIQRKKAKCMNTINNMNCNLIELTPQHESTLKKKKLKSKTQNFHHQGPTFYLNHKNNHQPQEQFVDF